ncbi:MAG TPA: hypothetical protein VNA30_07285, partial [Mycobacteriales bacterium]|nr:hypothetical protein [Mycobacteriales bacterium]
MTGQTESRLPHRAPAPEEVVGLLASPLRRRLIGLLDGMPRSLVELLEVAAAPARDVIEQLGRLESAGVVRATGSAEEVDHRYELVEDVFSRSVRDAA